MIKKRTSIFDVAKHAGVSHQTVSRVINVKPNVSASTRQKVLQAINNLGYSVNTAARSLASGKSSTVGIINLNTTLYGPVSMHHAIQDTANQLNYKIIYVTVDGIKVSQVRAAIKKLVHSNVDGILSIVPRGLSTFTNKELASYSVPIIVRDHPNIPSGIKVNQEFVAETATNFLINLGHKHIAFIGGDPQWYDAKERHKGWSIALKKAKLKKSIFYEGDWSAESGYKLCKKLLSGSKSFTAIVVCSDHVSLGVLKALNESKKNFVSVISTDNMRESAFYFPSLSTVTHDFEEMGKRYFLYLLSLINNEALPTFPDGVGVELIARESTKVTRVLK